MFSVCWCVCACVCVEDYQGRNWTCRPGPCLLTQLSVADWSSLTRAHCSMLHALFLFLVLSVTFHDSMFSLSDLFMPPLAFSLSHPATPLSYKLVTLHSLPVLLSLLIHVPISVYHSPFSPFQMSFSCLLLLSGWAKSTVAGLSLKVAVIGTCWVGCGDWVCLFSLNFLICIF